MQECGTRSKGRDEIIYLRRPSKAVNKAKLWAVAYKFVTYYILAFGSWLLHTYSRSCFTKARKTSNNPLKNSTVFIKLTVPLNCAELKELAACALDLNAGSSGWNVSGKISGVLVCVWIPSWCVRRCPNPQHCSCVLKKEKKNFNDWGCRFGQEPSEWTGIRRTGKAL